MLFLFLSCTSHQVCGFADWFTKDYCARKLFAGQVIMNNKAVASEERFVRVFRGIKELKSGDVYQPSESLTVSISEAKGQHVYEVSDGGARFENGGCEGRRIADKPKVTLVMPAKGAASTSEFEIVTAWATGHETVKISPPFRLIAAESKTQREAVVTKSKSKLSVMSRKKLDQDTEEEPEDHHEEHHMHEDHLHETAHHEVEHLHEHHEEEEVAVDAFFEEEGGHEHETNIEADHHPVKLEKKGEGKTNLHHRDLHADHEHDTAHHDNHHFHEEEDLHPHRDLHADHEHDTAHHDNHHFHEEEEQWKELDNEEHNRAILRKHAEWHHGQEHEDYHDEHHHEEEPEYRHDRVIPHHEIEARLHDPFNHGQYDPFSHHGHDVFPDDPFAHHPHGHDHNHLDPHHHQEGHQETAHIPNEHLPIPHDGHLPHHLLQQPDLLHKHILSQQQQLHNMFTHNSAEQLVPVATEEGGKEDVDSAAYRHHRKFVCLFVCLFVCDSFRQPTLLVHCL